ncbi:MAG: hypothetical protein CSA68_11610 [Rhodobacterales bacterium]|nr:MAG: hypothetical protein CSA68_11610 [Rhodobacterales bacterium]
MISRVVLTPGNRCIVSVRGYKIETTVKQALSEKQFSKQFLNQTDRIWYPLDGFRRIMRKRFDEAGYDFASSNRPNYGREASDVGI